jgi:acetyltransferase-like isoleucine patch superfamily enzyme
MTETPVKQYPPLTRAEFLGNLVLERLPAGLAKSWSRGLRCERGVVLKTPTRLLVGNHVVIQRQALLHCGGKSWCDFSGFIELDDHVVIGPHCVFYGAGGIHVGAYSHFGPGAMVIAQGGVTDSAQRYTPTPQRRHDPVVLGRGTWVGAGAVILGGTILGDGCTIGPNSVVSGSYPAGSTLIGNPARVARSIIVDNSP